MNYVDIRERRAIHAFATVRTNAAAAHLDILPGIDTLPATTARKMRAGGVSVSTRKVTLLFERDETWLARIHGR
jgi:hypothetical protein